MVKGQNPICPECGTTWYVPKKIKGKSNITLEIVRIKRFAVEPMASNYKNKHDVLSLREEAQVKHKKTEREEQEQFSSNGYWSTY
jgi:hypothetical protein